MDASIIANEIILILILTFNTGFFRVKNLIVSVWLSENTPQVFVGPYLSNQTTKFAYLLSVNLHFNSSV